MFCGFDNRTSANVSHEPLFFWISLELLAVAFRRPGSDLSSWEQRHVRSLQRLGGTLFDDAIIGALIDSATEITLIDRGQAASPPQFILSIMSATLLPPCAPGHTAVKVDSFPSLAWTQNR